LQEYIGEDRSDRLWFFRESSTCKENTYVAVEQRALLNPPAMILMMGVAGVGKSTLSRTLLSRISATYLDNNFVADAFSAASRTDPEYRRNRPRVYGALYRIAEENLRVGNSVLLDVPHILQAQDPDWCDYIAKLATGCGARLVVFRCSCSEKTLRDRLERRNEERDRWKLEHWDEFLQSQPLGLALPFGCTELCTESPILANLEQMLRVLAAA
jgi:predicted kinase